MQQLPPREPPPEGFEPGLLPTQSLNEGSTGFSPWAAVLYPLHPLHPSMSPHVPSMPGFTSMPHISHIPRTSNARPSQALQFKVLRIHANNERGCMSTRTPLRTCPRTSC